MTDQQQQNSSAGVTSGAQPQSGATSGADSRQQPSDADRAAEAARTAAAAKPERPKWASDDLWDADKNALREDALTERLTEAQKIKGDIEARRAAIAADPKAYYKAELPEDVLKALPKDWEIKADDPQWEQYRQIAAATDLTQEQFRNLVGLKVKMDLAAQQANKEAVTRHQDAINKELGDRGPERVEAVKQWFKGVTDEKTAGELQHTLWTPGVVKFMEQMRTALTSQGVTTFNGTGREGAADPGKIPNYDNLTFEQRWQHVSQPAANGRA